MKPIPIIGNFAFIPATWWILVLLVVAALTGLLITARCRPVRDDAKPVARRA